MIYDRGNIKWTAMMLPEHAEMLNKMWNQQEWKEKRTLDEHLIADINLNLQMALEHDLTIEVEYFSNYDYHKVRGKLLGVNPLLNYVRFEDKEIPLDSVTGAWIE